MRRRLLPVLSLLCLAGSLPCAPAADAILTAIPSDALAFAVVHNLADASRAIDDVAKLVQAPAPDVLTLAKNMTGLQKGLDEQGDLALVITSVDPLPQGVVLAPVADFAAFFAALNVSAPETGVVEVQLARAPTLVGRKGSYAVLAPATSRDLLEKFLASPTTLADNASLAEWLDANKASAVLTSTGVKQLLPKLTSGIRTLQTTIRQAGGEQGAFAADSLNLYVDLFTAAETEVDQFALGLRIDSAQTLALVKRVQFAPHGSWAQWAADAKPAERDLLAGLPAGPYVAAVAGAIPKQGFDRMMKFSVQMMQNNPAFKLTPEQIQKYVDLSTQSMRDVDSMAMVIGVAEPGAGLYANSVAVMLVDDSRRYLEQYEKTMAALRTLAQESKGAPIPSGTVKRVPLGDVEALEVSMEMGDMQAFAPQGGPDMKKMMESMLGNGGNLKIFLAPADDHAVLMAYTSLERLQAALDFYKSKQPGLAADAGVVKVAALAPTGAQFVAYASLKNAAEAIRRIVPAPPGASAPPMPDFPDTPPIGVTVKLSPDGLDGRLIITAETLKAIGDAVAKARAAATAPPQ